MLSSLKRFGRYLLRTEADMGARASIWNCAYQGRSISRKRVARLMYEAGLCAKAKRHRIVTTRRDVSHPVAPNILNRECTATAPNQKWATDITYIPTIQGWLYLAVILDLYWRAVA